MDILHEKDLNVASLINVGGTSRSGSTMVHLILGNAFDAFACGEVMNWFRPVKTHHFKTDCPCGEEPCFIWTGFSGTHESEFHAVAIKALGINFLIDSSKELSWIIDSRRWAAKHGINVYNVFVWKDPIDLAYSHWKRGKGLTFWRSQFVKYYRRVIEAGLPVLALNFSDLTSNPNLKIMQLCTAIGMPFYEGKERFWEKQHHHLYGSLGVRRQVEAGNSMIKPREGFPKEFDIYMDDLQNMIVKDSLVQELVRFLQQRDVEAVWADLNYRQEFLKKHPFPSWYYAQRLKRIYRKRFPKRFDPNRNEKIETIPLESN